MEFIADAVAAVHVAGHPGDVQRLAAIVALDQRDRFGGDLASIEQSPRLQGGLQAQRDFGLHVGELLLHQLIGGERPAELLAVQHISPGGVPAELGGAHRTPSDAETGAVEAAERTG